MTQEIKDEKTRKNCPICNHLTIYVGAKYGAKISFRFNKCNHCKFIYVENFRSDFANIYDLKYYSGKGVDPKVRYLKQNELKHKSIKTFEHDGIFKVFNKLCIGQKKWLDYGCGMGGLVKYANKRGIDAVGYDEGIAYNFAKQSGIPILNKLELDGLSNSFDFISAIEVIEHVSDPLDLFHNFRRLLKPRGILFLTTGNSRPFNNSVLKWHYTNYPDTHISFYEPYTLRFIMRKYGFSPGLLQLNDGYSEIIKYKFLNYLGFDNKKMFFNLIPLKLICRLIDYRYQLTEQPYGILNK